MLQPYSLALRPKNIDVYAEGNTYQPPLTQQFPVALSLIQKLVKQY